MVPKTRRILIPAAIAGLAVLIGLLAILGAERCEPASEGLRTGTFLLFGC